MNLQTENRRIVEEIRKTNLNPFRRGRVGKGKVGGTNDPLRTHNSGDLAVLWLL